MECRGIAEKATQMEKHSEVAETDEWTLHEDWRNKVDISTRYDEYRKGIIAIPEE